LKNQKVFQKEKLLTIAGFTFCRTLPLCRDTKYRMFAGGNVSPKSLFFANVAENHRRSKNA
jgi:hypothetical protein